MNERQKLLAKSKHGKKSQVDDDFFRLADMEVFLEQEDNKESRGMQGVLDDDELDLNEVPVSFKFTYKHQLSMLMFL